MTLHETAELIKKSAIRGGFGLVGLVMLFILIRVGIFVKNIIFPPKVQPPTLAYGKLPPIQFPKSSVSDVFTYTLNTLL